jgi:hypothetical protein
MDYKTVTPRCPKCGKSHPYKVSIGENSGGVGINCIGCGKHYSAMYKNGTVFMK